MLVILLLLVGAGCKSKKAAMAVTDPAVEKAKMEQEATLRKQQEESAKRKQELEAEARAAEAKRKETEPYRKLDTYFSAIANSNSLASANSSISEALGLFASKNTPVFPSTIVSSAPPFLYAITGHPEASASTSEIPKSSSCG